jgi:transposase-like protein
MGKAPRRGRPPISDRTHGPIKKNRAKPIKRTGKPGRPPTYDPEFHPAAAYEAFAKDGITRIRMAKVFGISLSTFYQWISLHSEFAESVNKGIDHYFTEIGENSLKTRVKGKIYTEKTVIKDGKGAILKEQKIRKQVQPSDTAVIFALKNRSVSRWRDRYDQAITADGLSLAINTGRDSDSDDDTDRESQ